MLSDALVVSASLTGAWLLADLIDAEGERHQVPPAMLAGAAVAWLLLLALCGAYDTRFLDRGSDEFKRVTVASTQFFALAAVVAFLGELDLSRPALLLMLALGVVLLPIDRWLARTWLGRQRVRGRLLRSTVVVGEPGPAAELTRLLEGDAGRVTGSSASTRFPKTRPTTVGSTM